MQNHYLKIYTLAVTFLAGVLLLATLPVLSSCSHDSDITGIDTTISYKTSIAPIVNSNCVMCHDGSNEFNLKGYNNLMSIVTPGDSKASDFYNVIATSWDVERMPPPPAEMLSEQQRTVINLWILQGAKNN